jgi:5-methylcytosine-specific restriction endonuclease McrA
MVDEIVQCGDVFLLRCGEEIIRLSDEMNVDVSKAKFRCEVGSHRRPKGKLTKKQIKTLLDMQEGECLICFKNVRTEEYHVDHWIPISLGGTNRMQNLSILCKRCNLKKGSRYFSSLGHARTYCLNESRTT